MAFFSVRSPASPLVVNTDPNRHYLVEKTEAEGMQELHRLASRAEVSSAHALEDAWMYIQGKDANDRTLEFWFEIGQRETVNSTRTSAITLGKMAAYLLERGIRVTAGVHYHYHPADPSNPKDIQVGDLIPSKSDLEAIPYFQGLWQTLQLGGSFQSAVVTRHGLWKMDWKGPDPKAPSTDMAQLSTYLQGEAQSAWNKFNFWNKYCLTPQGLCDNFYLKFSQNFATALTGVTFRPLGNGIPRGRIFPRFRPFETLPRDPGFRGYFRPLREQMDRDNRKLKDHHFEIQWDDPENLVTVVKEPNGDYSMIFNFVIDTNGDSHDGRIYMVDRLLFDKDKKLKAKLFDRYFTYPSGLSNEAAVKKFSEKYAKNVGWPEHSERIAFAQGVALKFLNLL